MADNINVRKQSLLLLAISRLVVTKHKTDLKELKRISQLLDSVYQAKNGREVLRRYSDECNNSEPVRKILTQSIAALSETDSEDGVAKITQLECILDYLTGAAEGEKPI